MTFGDAQMMAKAAGGRLLMIRKNDEEQFVTQHQTSEFVWLGLVRHGRSRDVYLTDRLEHHRVLQWSPGQPNLGDGEIFVILERARGWHDCGWDSKIPLVIEWGPE